MHEINFFRKQKYNDNVHSESPALVWWNHQANYETEIFIVIKKYKTKFGETTNSTYCHM